MNSKEKTDLSVYCFAWPTKPTKLRCTHSPIRYTYPPHVRRVICSRLAVPTTGGGVLVEICSSIKAGGSGGDARVRRVGASGIAARALEAAPAFAACKSARSDARSTPTPQRRAQYPPAPTPAARVCISGGKGTLQMRCDAPAGASHERVTLL